MFRGRFQHTIDDKGRLSIPVKYREALASLNGHAGEIFIVTTDYDQCLVAYPMSEWDQIDEKAKRLPSTDRHVKDYLRFIYSWAVECPLDRQGRILIPPALRDYASLRRETILVGMVNKIEIWDLERWNEKEAAFSENAEGISEAMARFGM